MNSYSCNSKAIIASNYRMTFSFMHGRGSPIPCISGGGPRGWEQFPEVPGENFSVCIRLAAKVDKELEN